MLKLARHDRDEKGFDSGPRKWHWEGNGEEITGRGKFGQWEHLNGRSKIEYQEERAGRVGNVWKM